MSDVPSYRLEGKTALVTGAGRGLGRAIALALADAGANVALGLRDRESGAELAQRITALGARATCLQMDVLDLQQGYDAIDKAILEFGAVDILVNNVGGSIQRPLEDFTETDFDRTIDLNVKSSFFLAQRVARHMMARQ